MHQRVSWIILASVVNTSSHWCQGLLNIARLLRYGQFHWWYQLSDDICVVFNVTLLVTDHNGLQRQITTYCDNSIIQTLAAINRSNVGLILLPRDASAERGNATVTRPSVRLSVTFRYQQHIGWNSWKIISRPNSLRPLLWLTPNMGDLVQREHPKIRVE